MLDVAWGHLTKGRAGIYRELYSNPRSALCIRKRDSKTTPIRKSLPQMQSPAVCEPESSSGKRIDRRIGRKALPPFWDLVFKLDYGKHQCWLWAGPLTSKGRATYCSKGKSYIPARKVYSELIGEIPNGGVITQSCHVNLCVNPKHLELKQTMARFLRLGIDQYPGFRFNHFDGTT